MPIAELLLPEFDQEMTRTRRVLERVPGDRLDWRPHDKSYTLGQLATHVAMLPLWLTHTMQSEELDLAPPDGPAPTWPKPDSLPAILATFDAEAKSARAALAGASDDAFAVTWTLKTGGRPVFSASRYSVVRETVLNHLIHHRAQLTVYLRQCGAPVPAIYGPSADEPNPW